jgi:hypothetical protein
LTIGGYESAWLADLVAAFVLENTAELFDETIYDRIYRDDGLVILDGVKSNAEVGEWLNSFQKKVNRVTGYEGLVFTVSIWSEEKNDEVGQPPRCFQAITKGVFGRLASLGTRPVGNKKCALRCNKTIRIASQCINVISLIKGIVSQHGWLL